MSSIDPRRRLIEAADLHRHSRDPSAPIGQIMRAISSLLFEVSPVRAATAWKRMLLGRWPATEPRSWRPSRTRMGYAAGAGLISATLAVASAQQPTDLPGPYDVTLTWTARLLHVS